MAQLILKAFFTEDVTTCNVTVEGRITVTTFINA